jgi:RecA-family ATPase
MQIERAPGGKSWADAMFMGNASNQEYIQAKLDRAQRIEKTIYDLPDKRIEAYFGQERFVLLYNGKIVMNQSYHYVDCCRGKSPDDFDKEIQKVLQSLQENEE